MSTKQMPTAGWGAGRGHQVTRADASNSVSANRNTLASGHKKQRHGYVDGEVWHRFIDGPDQMLHVRPGLAMDIEEFEDRQTEGATEVWIHRRDTGAVYSASYALIRAKGYVINYPGQGRQIALDLRYWRESGGTSIGSERAAASPLDAEPQPAEQLAFDFGD